MSKNISIETETFGLTCSVVLVTKLLFVVLVLIVVERLTDRVTTDSDNRLNGRLNSHQPTIVRTDADASYGGVTLIRLSLIDIQVVLF